MLLFVKHKFNFVEDLSIVLPLLGGLFLIYSRQDTHTTAIRRQHLQVYFDPAFNLRRYFQGTT